MFYISLLSLSNKEQLKMINYLTFGYKICKHFNEKKQLALFM